MVRAIVACCALVALAAKCTLASAADAAMPQDDRIPLAEAFRLSEQLGDKIWPGWHTAPFAVLLVTPEYEYLVRHDKPSADFVSIGYDDLLKSEVYRRARQFPTDLEATFPAVSDVPTIVIGEPGHTSSKGATAWVATLMHEHFHQLQSSRPGYFDAVVALGLAKGEKSGMWMLNFPFPYTAPAVIEKIAAMCEALRDPVTTAARYEKLRGQLRAEVSPDDAKYAGFQFWQEGVARYTEMRIADWAANNYTPSAAFVARPDFKPFSQHASALHARVNGQLEKASLANGQRGLFYAIGAAEGMLLDRTVPDWKSRYFAQPLDTEPYFRQ